MRSRLGTSLGVLDYSRKGLSYCQKYLVQEPANDEARADSASLLFYSGQTDKAIQQVGVVLQHDPNHVKANYNLGIFYWQGRRDLKAAKSQMDKCDTADPERGQQLGHARPVAAGATRSESDSPRAGFIQSNDLSRECHAMTDEHIEIAIVGGGPAGLAAALYASRGRVDRRLRAAPRRPIVTTDWVENYPGFPKRSGAAAVGDLMTKQAEEHGAVIRTGLPD